MAKIDNGAKIFLDLNKELDAFEIHSMNELASKKINYL